MSIGRAPYYWLVCDKCGATSTEDQEVTAWDSVEGVAHQAERDRLVPRAPFLVECACHGTRTNNGRRIICANANGECPCVCHQRPAAA